MQTLLPLAMFAFVASITPGPNNIMLTSSGLRFGFLRTIPHIAGVSAGLLVLLALCTAGVGSLVMAVPGLQTGFKAAGSAYLLYLAWQLRRMRIADTVGGDDRPMSFAGGALFQFINPKCWIMAITGATVFLPPASSPLAALALLCLVFGLVNLPCVSLWAGAGAAMRRALQEPRWQRLFSAVMVVATLYAALSIWH